jgi:hypothetical protein
VLLPVLILLFEKQVVLDGRAARHARLAFNPQQHGF